MKTNAMDPRRSASAIVVAVAALACLAGMAMTQSAQAATYEGGGEFVGFAGVTRTATVEIADHGDLSLSGDFNSAAYQQISGAIVELIETLEATPGPPQILLHPTGLTLTNGANVSFTIQFIGALPNTIQWLKNDQPIDQQAAASLNVAQVARSDEGDYKVIVTGPGGPTRSDTAALHVLTAQRISLVPATHGVTRFHFGDADGKPLPPTAIQEFTMQTSTDLRTWRDIPTTDFTQVLID